MVWLLFLSLENHVFCGSTLAIYHRMRYNYDMRDLTGSMLMLMLVLMFVDPVVSILQPGGDPLFYGTFFRVFFFLSLVDLAV